MYQLSALSLVMRERRFCGRALESTPCGCVHDSGMGIHSWVHKAERCRETRFLVNVAVRCVDNEVGIDHIEGLAMFSQIGRIIEVLGFCPESLGDKQPTVTVQPLQTYPV
jgi:hypothetical protein